MSEDTPIVIIGGNGPVGLCFMQWLAALGLTAEVISRRELDVPPGFMKTTVDLNNETDWQAPQGAVIVSFLPLWILTGFLPCLSGTQAIIATGSTSLFGKAKSGDIHEREVVQKLEQAEKFLINWASQNNIQWTILRPTMIYDGKNDRNITHIAQFIKRRHFFPLTAPAKGLRQPIYVDDVAKAAIKCVGNPKAFNKAFNISGREILPYRVMVERIFEALKLKPRLILLPGWLLQLSYKIGVKFGYIKSQDYGAAVFQRMNEDLVFPITDGIKALDYQPRAFKPEFLDI